MPAFRRHWRRSTPFRPDAEVDALLAGIDKQTLEDALRDAQTRSLAFDAGIKPIGEVVDRVDKQLARPNTGTVPRRDFVAARLRYYAQRYDTEAQLNQSIASLYDLEVRKGNLSSGAAPQPQSEVFLRHAEGRADGRDHLDSGQYPAAGNETCSGLSQPAPVRLPSRSPSTYICARSARGERFAEEGKRANYCNSRKTRGPLPAFAGLTCSRKSRSGAILPVFAK